MPIITKDDCFLDFETRSRAKLADVGAWKYSEHESTKALCLAYSFGDEEPELWTHGQPQPQRLVDAFANKPDKHGWNGCKVHGWNALSFERAIFENVMFTQHGWLVPDLDMYHDTQLDALSLALPASLGACGDALGMDISKDKEGKRLIQSLCKPITAGKLKGEFRERDIYFKDYAALYVYCKQDVRSEKAIYHALPYHIEFHERELMMMIARMNERGLPIDIPAVEAIIRGVEVEKGVIKYRFSLLTGISSPTKRVKYLAWMAKKLEGSGVVIENTQAETLRDVLKDKRLPRVVRMSILMAQAINKTSVAKFPKVLAQICEDGTVKNNFIFNKANTGRLAGAGFQVQNLVADAAPDPEPLIDAFVDDEYDFIRMWGGVLNTAASLTRATIRATQDKKFLNGDLKGVEARGARWIAEEWDQLELIKQGYDPYSITAAEMYNVKPSQVMADKKAGGHMRQAGKISELSGSFGGGYKALLKMALKMGMVMDAKTAKKYNRDFRLGRPLLVAKWGHFGDAATKAVMKPGIVFPVDKTRRFSFVRSGSYLYMILPNKRTLSFPFPRMVTENFYGTPTTNVSAMWMSSYTHKWDRRTITGANFFQSADQGICRDLIMGAHLRTEKAGFPLVLSVHDEQMSHVPDDIRYSLDEYEKLMCVVPKWAEGFPINADCWEGYRFKK